MIQWKILNLLVKNHEVDKLFGILIIFVDTYTVLSHVFRSPKEHSINVKFTDATFHLFNEHLRRRFLLRLPHRFNSLLPRLHFGVLNPEAALSWRIITRRSNIVPSMLGMPPIFSCVGLIWSEAVTRSRPQFILFYQLLPINQFVLSHLKCKQLEMFENDALLKEFYLLWQ